MKKSNRNQRQHSPRSLLYLGSILFIVTSTLGAVSGATNLLVCGISFLPPLIVAWYLTVSGQREVFHPLSFFLLTLTLGVTSQTFYLIYLDDGSHRFALGGLTDIHTIITAIIAISIGTIFLLAGYAAKSRWSAQGKAVYATQWNLQRVQIVVILCLIIGVISLAYYASVFNILENIGEELAVKRRFVNENTGVSNSLSWVRFGVNFTQIAFFIAYAAFLDGRMPRSRLLTSLVIISGIFGVLMPFLASSRTGLLIFLLGAAAIHHFSRGGWTARQMRITASVLISIVVLMGTLRYVQMRGIEFSAYKEDVAIAQMFQPILGSDNFLSVGKTAVILEAIPEKLDYQYGKTYLLWIIAPIPRAFWPEKPIISIGLELGQKIMGTFASGTPPGVVGELYYNFGWFGIPFGMFIFGLVLRWYYEKYGRYSYVDINTMQIYASTVVLVGFIGLSSDFTGAVTALLQKLVPLLLILKFVSKQQPKKFGRRNQELWGTRQG